MENNDEVFEDLKNLERTSGDDTPVLDDVDKELEAFSEEEKKLLAELEVKKKELLEKKRQINLAKPLSVTIRPYNLTQLAIKTSQYREDYVKVMQTLYTRRWDAYERFDILGVKDYPTWKEKVSALKNVTIKYVADAEAYIDYLLNGPDIWIKKAEKDLTIQLKPPLAPYQVFSTPLESIALRQPDKLFHVPFNESGKFLVHFTTLAGLKVKWEDDAKEIATKDLELRQELDSIALAKDAPEYDLDLCGHRLKPFQRVGVKFGVYTKGRFLIADEMGLGKTIQAIAIAKQLDFKKIAIFCPASVKENWKREIKKFTNEDARLMYGVQPSTADMAEILDSPRRWFVFNYDIVARPIADKKEAYGMVEVKERYLWIEAINALGFDFVILDEAHKCKNPDAARTKAVQSLKVPNVGALTGTPVLNRPMELHPILKLIGKEQIPNASQFERRYTDGKYGVRNLKELRELLRPYMIRRVKSEVMTELPPIVRDTRYIELNPKQKKIYTKLLNSILVDIATGEVKGEINHVLVKILKMKQFLSAIKAEAVADLATELYDQAEQNDTHKKVIVFSQFVPIVHRITKLLSDGGGKNVRMITGQDVSIEGRQPVVDEFQNNPAVQYLVATPQSTSEGLNITAAGSVIFADFMWTPASHQQAEGRAYGRLSDPHTITSYYFAVQQTLDDWLQSILLQKMDTIEQVVDGVNIQRASNESIIKEMIRALKNGEI